MPVHYFATFAIFEFGEHTYMATICCVEENLHERETIIYRQ